MDEGMLSAVFLAASRSLSRRQHPKVYAPIALRYKAECLRLLNLAITAEGSATSEATITKTLALASEELFAGSKATADRHLQAAAFMVHGLGRPARIAMWRHDDNIHMWTHWEDIMAGVDSDTICQYAVAQHFALSMRQSQSPAPTSLRETTSLSIEIS
jgi:transcription factor-like protein